MNDHVIVIDDEEAVRNLLRQILGKEGYRVSVAKNGLEARRLIEQDAPKLIICDLHLPGEDGFSLCKEFKERMPTVPRILLSGMIFEPSVEQQLGESVSAYVPKPTNFKQILLEARRLLGN